MRKDLRPAQVSRGGHPKSTWTYLSLGYLSFCLESIPVCLISAVNLCLATANAEKSKRFNEGQIMHSLVMMFDEGLDHMDFVTDGPLWLVAYVFFLYCTHQMVYHY